MKMFAPLTPFPMLEHWGIHKPALQISTKECKLTCHQQRAQEYTRSLQVRTMATGMASPQRAQPTGAWALSCFVSLPMVQLQRTSSSREILPSQRRANKLDDKRFTRPLWGLVQADTREGTSMPASCTCLRTNKAPAKQPQLGADKWHTCAFPLQGHCWQRQHLL